MGEDRRVARSLERRALLDQLELELFELMVVYPTLAVCPRYGRTLH